MLGLAVSRFVHKGIGTWTHNHLWPCCAPNSWPREAFKHAASLGSKLWILHCMAPIFACSPRNSVVVAALSTAARARVFDLKQGQERYQIRAERTWSSVRSESEGADIQVRFSATFLKVRKEATVQRAGEPSSVAATESDTSSHQLSSPASAHLR